MAPVESTLGTASVPRDFNWGQIYEPPPEAIEPMVIVCNKEGFIEFRATGSLAWAFDVALEERPRRDVSPAASDESSIEAAGKVIGGVAVVGAQVAGAPALQASVVGPVALGVLVVAAIANKDAPREAVYAYRALPELLLIPATFESNTACDAFFATLKTWLEAARDAKRERFDAECRFWPCKSSDATPCADPVCERRRKQADAQLASELERLPALRA